MVRPPEGTPTVADVDLVMEELYSLQQRVDSIEQSFSPPANPVPSNPVVGYMSPAPRHVVAPATRTPKSAKKAPKSTAKIPIGKKRRSKRSKDGKRVKKKDKVPSSPKAKSRAIISHTPRLASAPSRPRASPKPSRSSPIPWAKTPKHSLPTRFSSPPPTESNGFISNDSGEIFKPTTTTSINVDDERRRPLLLAKKLYGHFVNLQTQYVDLKTTLDRQTNSLNSHHFKMKKISNSNLLLKQENELLQARIRVALSISEKKSLKAQSSVTYFLNSFNRKLIGTCLNHWRSYVQLTNTQRQKMARFLLHWKYRHVRLVFDGWLQVHAGVRSRKDKLSTFQKRWSSHILLRGFNKFKLVTSYITERQESLQKLTRTICETWLNRTVAGSFQVWADKVEHMGHVEVTTRRILRHWTNAREVRR